MEINLNIAEKISEKCLEKAEKINVPMIISIVGDDGRLIIFKKMDGALPVSIKISQAKAYTAYALKMRSDKLGELSQPGKMLYGIDTVCDNIVLFGGGFPLKVNGEVIGALGVSGGSVEEDMSVAEAGVKFFNNRYTNSL
ncbi:hypothetical protein HSACCH_00265 [Halanaerobium saccharolyticum subsp. saccharolyticum DSM 6643]|uniref:ATP:cob(I)alamin adenosyltransferase n=1 Tax=Halanaerobium saccharolyticum subsp. saccharolyticum DSM 6643 TaxID=1293054 RepID=M5DXS6_9FIRM|nr:heme-binding protein [Halanaerobium saccharolyticum]CCU77911.1 hypothetical protein HSACCH_00265 [Halanaerobium saccharolyticum subsp. saccharolyticum DSM 6643]